MLQIRGDADLGEESLDAEHRAELGVEHLERDVAVVPDVAREVHRRHAAAPISRSISYTPSRVRLSWSWMAVTAI